MKKLKLICFLLGISIYGNAQNMASFVIEYKPAPGQHINILQIGTPLAAQKMPENEANLVSLGGFGGFIVMGFEQHCANYPENPYGIDFTIFGNAFAGSSEPGVIWVMKDENKNGKPDDIWFEIAGSNHFHSKTIKNYQVTYFKTESRDVRWSDNSGNSGIQKANSYNLQEYYPIPGFFPDFSQDSVSFKGTLLEAVIDNSNLLEIKSQPLAFGYSDNRPKKQGIVLTIPDNPYTPEIEGAGGDPIDISWAVDSLGNYVDLDTIHFVKIVTGYFTNLGGLGEASTDVSYVVDVESESGISGKENLLVVYHHPKKVILGKSIQLEANYFIKGRKTMDAIQFSSSNPQVASVDQTGKLIAKSFGETELFFIVQNESNTTKITVVVPGSMQFLSDFSSVYPGDSVLLDVKIFDNEGDELILQPHFSISNPEMGEIITVNEKSYFVAFKSGETNIKITVEGFDLEKTVPLKIWSESEKIRVYITIKTENENYFPLQWVEIGLADLNPLVENRQTDYSSLNRHFLGHVLLSGLLKSEVNFKFRDDENSGKKLYLYSVEKHGMFSYGWGGKISPQAFAKAWIVRLNNKQYLHGFDIIQVANGDTVTLYHISNINQNWPFTRLFSDKDSAQSGENINLLYEKANCSFSNDTIMESGFLPEVNKEIFAGQSYFTNDKGKVSLTLTSDLPLIAKTGNDAVLISKKVITGTKTVNSFRIQVYPNPVENELTFTGMDLTGAKLYVFNANGQQMVETAIESEIFVLNTRTFPLGLYHAKVVQKKIVEAFKFIKNR